MVEKEFPERNDSIILDQILLKHRRILLCANDEGGAEVISSWAAKKGIDFDYILGKSAIDIFDQKISNLKSPISLSDIKHDLLISSIGWQSNFEYEVILQAQSKGSKVMIFLDHYGNYFEGLTRSGVTLSVDWVVAFDSISLQKAIREISATKAFVIENIYVADVVNKTILAAETTAKTNRILYLAEPHRVDDTYSEMDAIAFFFTTLSEHDLVNENILIRLHPSENPEKYSSQIPPAFVNTQVSRRRSLISDIACSNYAVGSYTTALRIAELSGVQTFSTLPGPPVIPTVPFRPLSELIQVLQVAKNY